MIETVLAIATMLGLPFWQHGPNVPCKQWCAPKGHEDHAEPPEGIPVVACKGDSGPGCATPGGEQCTGDVHRQGCTEFCRHQCCSCCSI